MWRRVKLTLSSGLHGSEALVNPHTPKLPLREKSDLWCLQGRKSASQKSSGRDGLLSSRSTTPLQALPVLLFASLVGQLPERHQHTWRFSGLPPETICSAYHDQHTGRVSPSDLCDMVGKRPMTDRAKRFLSFPKVEISTVEISVDFQSSARREVIGVHCLVRHRTWHMHASNST